MNRSSSRKDLRTERLGVTPYSRKPLQKSSSWNPLASLRSLASSFVRRNDDDASVSGSDEEWNGQAPEAMRGEDVFSLASAAGRGGADFEERAQTWREGKAKLRSSRMAPPTSWDALGLSQAEKEIRPSASMSALRTTETARQQQPLPRGIRPSGSTLALRRFMEDKGVEFSAEDADVLEGLARSLRADNMRAAPLEESRPARLGNWSAGTPSYPLPKAEDKGTHPLRVAASEFSIGTSGPVRASSTTAPRKITYLGPGMSTRRLTRPAPPPRKPIFDNLEFAKKRKVDSDAIDVDEPIPEIAAAASVASAFNASKRKVSMRTSPLQEAREPSPKKRGDDVLRDLIEETLGPEATTPSIVINPYEDLAPPPSGKVAPLRSSLRKSSSSLKHSMRGSASRGAAEKLVNVGTSTRKKSTLEMVSNYKSNRDAPVSVSPEPVSIPNPGAALKESTAFAPSPKPADKPTKLPELSSFKPLPVTSLSSSMIQSTPKRTVEKEAREESPAVATILAKSTPAPVFNPPTVGLGAPPAVLPSVPSLSRPPTTRRVDPSAIYLSAKDSALNVDKAALPFYTFTLPAGISPEPSDAIKDAARARPAPTFTFTMREPSLPSSFLSGAAGVTAVKAPSGAQWKCDKCELQNPDSAKEKCTICEEPRPGAAPAATVSATTAPPKPPAGGFSFPKPAAKAGEWTCNTCDLQNPDSAKEKCTICEAPRPGAAPAPKAAPAAPPAVPSGGFSFGTPAASAAPAAPAAPAAAPAAPTTGGFTISKPIASAGEWTCDTCMLQNPSTATEKCTVCEEPKPGVARVPAAPPAALPTPPSGGFSFGSKPAASVAPAPGGFTIPKPAVTPGEWTCDECMLQNPSTATEKCTICEAPKPGAAPAAPAPPATLPTPPSGGFTFGGAKAAAPPAPPTGAFSFGGAKPAGGPPAPPTGGFSFGGKPVAAGPAPPSAGGFTFGGASPAGLPTPPSGGFTFGQSAGPAAAPLLKPTGGAGEWTCGTCGLQNPASATEKCTICEEPKP